MGGRAGLRLRSCTAVVLSAALPFTLSGCVYRVAGAKYVERSDPQMKANAAAHAAKVHLRDGSVVIFPDGFEIAGDRITGSGTRWDLTRSNAVRVSDVALDEVAGVEYYDDRIEPVPTALATAGITVGAVIGGAVLALILFGSCPTLYADEGKVLEAEAFSRSIAPAFEATDVDRLPHLAATESGLSIQVANEALETHYIDELSLLEVVHPPGVEIFPAAGGGIAPFGRPAPVSAFTSRSGDSAGELLGQRDGAAYRSPRTMVEALTREAGEDWIDFDAAVPAGATTMTVALRARNTLMTTVLFYDLLLASRGAGAIDWMADDLGDPTRAREFAEWFRSRFGMRIELGEGGEYREIGYVPASGPIAWAESGIRLPAPEADRVRLRISFLPDNWMIDWVGISFEDAEDYTVRRLPVAAARPLAGGGSADAADLLRSTDDRRLVTRPGDRYELSFEPHPAPPGRTLTFLAESRGYYIEWLRPDWLRTAGAGTAVPQLDDAAVMTLAERWLASREELESSFFTSRVSRPAGEGQ